MPLEFNESGVRFLYPENWTIAEQQFEDWPRSVSLEAPQGAIWTLHLLEGQLPLSQVTEEALADLRREYPDLDEALPTRTEPAPGVEAVGYEASFFYLDLLVRATVNSFPLGEHTALLLIQAEDRDYDQLAPVFEAILKDLLERSE